jgi:hypothetical protein
MTTSANGNYEISQKSTADVPEDRVNVTKGLTEAPNQSSEDIDISDFSPPVKASPGHNLLFYYTAIYIYLRILCIKFLRIA